MNITPQTSLLASVLQGKRSSGDAGAQKTSKMSDFLAHLSQVNVRAEVVRNEPIAQRKLLDLLDKKVGLSQDSLTQLSSSFGELPSDIQPVKVGENQYELSVRQLLAWAGAANIPTQAGTLPTADWSPQNWSAAIGKLTNEVKTSVESAIQEAVPSSVKELFTTVANCFSEGDQAAKTLGLLKAGSAGFEGEGVEVKGHPISAKDGGSNHVSWGHGMFSGAFASAIDETNEADAVSVKGHPISAEMTKLMAATQNLWQSVSPGEAATLAAQTTQTGIASVIGTGQTTAWNAGSTKGSQEVKDGVGRFGVLDGTPQTKMAELLTASGAKIVSADGADADAENQSSVNAIATQAVMNSAKTVKNAAFGFAKANGVGPAAKVSEFEKVLETASPESIEENQSVDLADSLLKSMKSVRKAKLDSETDTQTGTFSTDMKVEVKLPTITKEAAQKVILQTSDAMSDLAAAKRPGSVIIKLNPDELGSLTVRVKSTGSTIEANVTASNEAVREALHAHRADLVKGVESKGFSLGSLQIGNESASQPANPAATQASTIHANLQHNGQGHHQEKSMTQDFERMGNMAAHLKPTEQIASQQVVASTIGVNYLA